MAKRKFITQLEKEGYELVPDTAGRIIDSIWVNNEKQILKIRFATGKTLTFQPVD